MGVFRRAAASLRTRLLWLVVGALLPVAVLAIAGLAALGQRQHAQAREGLIEQARALASAVDRELLASVSALEILALSDKLDSRDLARFHAEASAAVAARPSWDAVLLVDPAGNRLLSTRVPFGAPLPGGAPVVERESFDVAIVRGGAVIGNVARGPGGRALFPLRVPVARGDELRYVLTAIVRPEAMLAILDHQRLPADAVASIFDNRRSIVARSRMHEEYVAKPLAESLRRVMAQSPEGWASVTTLEGQQVYGAYSRSARSNWGVAVGVPTSDVDVPIWRSYVLYGTGIALSLALGLLTAARLARRISDPIAGLGAAARAVGAGEVPEVPPPALPEVDVVARALHAAATDLRRSKARLLLTTRLYALLSHTNQCVVHLRDRDTLLKEVCRGTVEIGQFAGAWIGWLAEGAEVTGVAASAGLDEAALARELAALRERRDVRAHVVRIANTGRAETIAELAAAAPEGGAGPSAGPGLTVVGLPIQSAGRVCALLLVHSAADERFEGAELRLLAEVATDIGFALDQIELEGRRAAAEAETRRLNASLAQHAERLRILHEIDRALIGSETPQSIAGAVLQPLRELLGVPRAIVNLFDLERGEVEWLAAAGRRRIHVGPGVRYSIRLMGDLEALERGEPQVIDVATLPPGPEVDGLLASGVQVYMAVPMIAHGELIGAISFGGATATFPREQVEIARAAADQFAIVIAQARLHERVRQQAEELERRVAERTAQLEAANKELEAFSYTASHDLRAPLRAIDGYSRMIEEDHSAGLDAEGRRLLAVVRAETQRMGRLIDDLLAFSRLGRKAPVPAIVDMNALARGALDELLAAAGGARPEVDLAPLPAARGDATLLYQVWANLLGNAIKFSSRQARPRVEVSGQLDGANAIYRISDNGAGFDMQYYDQLFAVFQRLHTQAEFEGTGIGLATVKRILERQQGAIWAESAPGAGATFWFSLPAGGPGR